ncbi:MAG: Chagasin family peptidase inhibitor I42 [Smithella sp. PtaU1.Bin162]|nr:MAG: Chagasin family peptidase inhibitor I42 [Smithella sp. PtaU1.Bin162]
MKIMNCICRILKNKPVICGIIALIICSIPGSPAAAGKISLTEADNRRAVEINAGDDLEVILTGNPTTGYVWESVEADQVILPSRGGYKYTPASAMVGSAGQFVFSFRAAAAGETPLRIVYRRPFEKSAAPLKFFEVLVRIK